MIASLRGEVVAIELDHAVIECAGVGYKFLATPPTLGSLRRGEESRVLTSLAVKEDAMTLYGFTSAEERAMFSTLQVVSGLGPKLALAALSVLEAGELAAAIQAGEVKKLQSIPGVGKRMAERMALELKDKVQSHIKEAPATNASIPAASGPVLDEVTEALVGLGFNEKSVVPVVEAVLAENSQADNAVVLRQSLARLGRQK